jgi:Patatin-like phospholipase
MAATNGLIEHLRDYKLPSELSSDITIVDAARATSAATTFFEPVVIGGEKYVDGALDSNNPVARAWIEAKNIWDERTGDIDNLLACFVSLGTGNPGMRGLEERALGFAMKTMVDIVTETEETARAFADDHRRWLVPAAARRYFRFNVEQGLQDVGLEEYAKEKTIRAATKLYLADRHQKAGMSQCADILRLKQSATPFSTVIADGSDKNSYRYAKAFLMRADSSLAPTPLDRAEFSQVYNIASSLSTMSCM